MSCYTCVFTDMEKFDNRWWEPFSDRQKTAWPGWPGPARTTAFSSASPSIPPSSRPGPCASGTPGISKTCGPTTPGSRAWASAGSAFPTTISRRRARTRPCWAPPTPVWPTVSCAACGKRPGRLAHLLPGLLLGLRGRAGGRPLSRGPGADSGQGRFPFLDGGRRRHAPHHPGLRRELQESGRPSPRHLGQLPGQRPHRGPASRAGQRPGSRPGRRGLRLHVQSALPPE